jgi:hypothetical protein
MCADNCAEYHPQCARSRSKLDCSSNRCLPSRILDTGPIQEVEISVADMDSMSLERMPYLRVCDTRSFPMDTKYLTLSHRWSDPPTITLNNATLEQFRNSIPLSAMLQPEAATLRQAVHVTRCLGFRYLWIDALCINQEDEQDKQHEISFMGEIYAGSELNISATAACSGSEGLFHPRNPMEVEPCRKRVRFYRDSDWVRGDIIVHTTRWEDEVDFAPLNWRGWVFQEGMLAPRVLHFARHQVYWSCVSLLAAEVLPYGNPDLVSAFGNDTQTWHLGIPLDETSAVTHQRTWAMLVTNYSRTSLTLPQDKLVAMSAISRRVCTLRNFRPGDYLAGLWRQDLPWQLLWFVIAPWETELRQPTYIAPSWSWASLVTGGVLWTIVERGDIVAELVDVSVSLKTTDPFGELTSGYIRLRGPMCKLARRISNSSEAVELDLHGTYYHRNVVQTSWDYVPEEYSEDNRGRQGQNITPPYLYLFMIEVFPGGHQETCRMEGLILQPIVGVKGRYWRLGYFHINTENPELIGNAHDLFSTSTLQDDEYIRFDGSAIYVIEII